MRDAATVVLGFDYGKQRIGVAVGQTVTQSATPLETLSAIDNKPDWDAIANIINEWKPHYLIVGDPLDLHDQATEITQAARKFAKSLEEKFSIPVLLQDERMSSNEASSIIRHQRQNNIRTKRQKKTDVDKLAAALIVERWLAQTEL